jgi:hypothetical protein
VSRTGRAPRTWRKRLRDMTPEERAKALDELDERFKDTSCSGFYRVEVVTRETPPRRLLFERVKIDMHPNPYRRYWENSPVRLMDEAGAEVLSFTLSDVTRWSSTGVAR